MWFEIILQHTQTARKEPSLLRQNFRQDTWKYQKLIVSLQRERRNRVEPRCAERWHGCRAKPVEMMSNSTLPLGFLHSLMAGHMWPAYFITRRVSEKILVFFLVRIGIITYLCIRTSALSLGGGAGATLWENNNKRLLLFGIALRIYQIQKETKTEWISRRRSCIMHGRDLSGFGGLW